MCQYEKKNSFVSFVSTDHFSTHHTEKMHIYGLSFITVKSSGFFQPRITIGKHAVGY